MIARVFAVWLALVCLPATPADARRVALVIGQNAYTGIGALANPGVDARRMAALLAKHGFEVLSCGGSASAGQPPGCFDLDRTRFLAALTQLEQRAAGAEMALVYFAGHGVTTPEGNILTPVDASVNCATGAITAGVPVERIMQATNPAKAKMVILDACRDNPLGAVCPALKGKALSFSRIEAGAMRDFLLVTSTQFGQQALDGLPGAHSPFAQSLFAAFHAHPTIYFEQLMNEVARATHATALANNGFLQIPGKVVGGAAPADCLAGKACTGDVRMAALAIENEKLTQEASGVRNLLAAEEKARGKPYTPEERAKRVGELESTLASIGASSDPLRQEARRLIDGGNRSKADIVLPLVAPMSPNTSRTSGGQGAVTEHETRLSCPTSTVCRTTGQMPAGIAERSWTATLYCT
jgi:Caspase domain